MRKVPQRLALGSAIALTVSTFLTCSPAAADTSGLVGNETGGDVSSGFTQTAAEAEQSSAKLSMAKSWYKAKFGGGSAATYEKEAAAYAKKYGKSTIGTATLGSEGVSALASPASASLPVTQYGQTKSFYCGPASGYMILKYKGNTISQYNGASLSQAA